MSICHSGRTHTTFFLLMHGEKIGVCWGMSSKWIQNEQTGIKWLVCHPPEDCQPTQTTVAYGRSSNQMLLCRQEVGRVLQLVERKQLQWEDVRCIKLDAWVLTAAAVEDFLFRETHLQCANWPMLERSKHVTLTFTHCRKSVMCGLSFSAEELERSKCSSNYCSCIFCK